MTIDQRKQRWRQFYDRSYPATHMLLIRYRADPPVRPLPHPAQTDARIEWAWDRYRYQLGQAEWLEDDTVPHLDVYTGTEIFAEAFGCRVHRPNDNMPFALPMLTHACDVATLQVPTLDTPCLRRLFDIADALRARSGNGAVLRMVDIQSPMDIAALIWEKTSFYLALLESPEAVQELANKVGQLLTAFLDEWFSRYGRDFVAHYPDYYVPRGITLSEDEIGAVGCDMFDAYFVDELAALSRRYGGIGIHCCAHAQHHWAGLAAVPGLLLLNLVQPEDVLREAYAFFAPHAAQMHGWCGGDDVVGWAEALPPESRVVINVTAGTREEALRLLDELRAVR